MSKVKVRFIYASIFLAGLLASLCCAMGDFSKRGNDEGVIHKEVRNTLKESEETMVIILLREPEGLRKKSN